MPVDNAVLRVFGLGINEGICINNQSFYVGLNSFFKYSDYKCSLKFSSVSIDGEYIDFKYSHLWREFY